MSGLFSYRCSWMAVCDLCCNAQPISYYSSCIVFASLCAFSCVNCPAVICLPNTILSCGETPLVNCGPRSFSLILLYNLLPVFLLQTILFPFDTINHLFSARPERLTTSLSSWGRVIWLCCAGLYFNLGVILVSFCFDNLGFILREILA